MIYKVISPRIKVLLNNEDVVWVEGIRKTPIDSIATRVYSTYKSANRIFKKDQIAQNIPIDGNLMCIDKNKW